jgi:hypothetical protein
VGPCRRSCWARQQVRGPVVLASKYRSGTLTRKRSLVQIQYGPPGISCSWPYQVRSVALQLPCSERYWDQVVVKFLFENSPVDLGVPMERGA